MDGFGARLRARAVELGLSDAEVARRAGLTSTRYGHYVTDYREPDLATLMRICQVLGTSPDRMLGYTLSSAEEDALASRRGRIAGFSEILDAPTLDVAVDVMQALAATVDLRASTRAEKSKRR